MQKPANNKYSELFEVIEGYARREYDYQDKALQVIAGAYVFMFEPEDMPDAGRLWTASWSSTTTSLRTWSAATSTR